MAAASSTTTAAPAAAMSTPPSPPLIPILDEDSAMAVDLDADSDSDSSEGTADAEVDNNDDDGEGSEDEEEDEDEDEDAAASGNDMSSVSLASEIHEYITKHGRRYHSYFGMDKYPVPSDEIEQDRLDMHHEIMLLLLGGKLHLAPLGGNPQRILDIGTGTGIWAMDMADKYPTAKVIGTDLSPIQSKWVPPNCRFEVDDAEDECCWTYRPTDYFDFIHARNIAFGITDWPLLLARAYRCIKPGGYIELAELGTKLECDDGTLRADDAAKRTIEFLAEAMTAMGRPPVNHTVLQEHLHNTGFVDIQVAQVKQPIGPWHTTPAKKQIGAMVLLVAETGLRAFCMEPFTTALGMAERKATKWCREALRAMKNPNTHMYTSFYIVHARKPRG